MDLLIVYTDVGGVLRIVAAYSNHYAMERRVDFRPVSKPATLLEVAEFLDSDPLSFAKYFRTRTATDLDEDSMVQAFSKKLFLTISQFGDEKAIAALSMGSREGDE